MKRLEIGIAFGQRAILGIQRDRALEVGDSLGVLTSLRVSDSEHVERVIVVGIFVAYEPEMRNCLVVLSAVQRQRRGVQALIDRLRRALAGGRLPPADAQVQPNTFLELLFVRVLAEHRLQQVDGAMVVVALEGLQSPLVQRDGLNVGRSAG